MEVDFSEVEEVENYQSVPDGRYLCRVAEVRQGWTQAGDERWTFRLEVVEGDFAGKTAAWDGVSWGERGRRRAKHVLGSMGFDVAGRIALDAGDLIDRQARVTVIAEERVDAQSGVKQVRPRVPFQGYEPVDEPF
ncbi:DUF669 domain-containing protein [Engelhardtia mirabilis]|uniref:DUF669 domain-containing protein n=1 Tax=Engelhardtia mirabilis TaxID=2528011 RepID=A0A518BFE8_9BACT|nr:hypothetical protein Pla133_07750 [Planctomycetes bacterium Pla133]QDV00036.1 hypothetical protein Pla86_07740 [Planctomycetes bacterium Pla86]